jgi:hypothetical protein
MEHIKQFTATIALSLFLIACGGGEAGAPDGATSKDSTGVATDGKITTGAEASYACPMHPEVTGKEGDACPKCGMTLEKVN